MYQGTFNLSKPVIYAGFGRFVERGTCFRKNFFLQEKAFYGFKGFMSIVTLSKYENKKSFTGQQ